MLTQGGPGGGAPEIAAGVAVAGATLGWAAVFPRWGFAPALAGAALGSALGSAALARRRLPALMRAAALAAAGAVYATAVALREPPTPAALAELARSLRDGWAQLLDATLPAPATGGPMATAVAVVWAAGAVAAAQAHAGRRARALLPALAVLGAGLAFGAGGGAVPPAAPAVVVAAGAALLLPARPPGAAARATRLGSLALAAGLVAVAFAGGSHWPGAGANQPYDPRRLRDQPIEVAHPANPLNELGAAVSDPSDPVLFRARVQGPVARWRLVVLDRFDGQRWASTGAFRRVGAGLRVPDPGTPVAETTQQVRLESLDGPFLPAFASPTAVGVDGVAADGAGVLVVPDGARRPRAYRVTSAVPAYDSPRIEAAAPVPGGQPPHLEGATGDRLLGALAEATAGANPSAAGRLQAVAVWFSERFALASGEDSAPVPTGNGLFHIVRLLDERTGTAEQFASAFAVLARLQGYQARVVVGYRAGQRDPATGELVVRAHHAHAWPEVRFEGIGWVAFEPTPTSPRLATEAAELAGPGAAGQEPGQPASAGLSPIAPPVPGSGGAGDQAGPGEASGSRRRPPAVTAALVVGAGAGVAVVLLAAVAGAKGSRRRRQQAGSPAERVAGAWSASLDCLAEAGIAVPSSLGAAEVASHARVPPGVAGALAPLAGLANAARFSGGAVGEAEAGAAWRAAAEVAGALRSGRSRRARARLALSPAPLLRRSP